MNATERASFLQVRASDEERAMLFALADDRGLSASDVVRTMIRDAYRERFGDKKPKKPRAAK
jgi:hypothetical protein